MTQRCLLSWFTGLVTSASIPPKMIFARSGLVDVGDLHIGPYESGVFDIRGSRDYSITFHVLERNLTSQMDGLLGLGWEYVDVSIHVPEAILWLGWPELKP